MKAKPTNNELGWRVSFRFAALSPLIGVALGFAAAGNSTAPTQGRFAIRFRTVEIAFGGRAGLCREANADGHNPDYFCVLAPCCPLGFEGF